MRLQLNSDTLVVTVEQTAHIDADVVLQVACLVEENDMATNDEPLDYACQMLGEVVEEAMGDEYPPYKLWWSDDDGVGYFHEDDDDVAEETGYRLDLEVRID